MSSIVRPCTSIASTAARIASSSGSRALRVAISTQPRSIQARASLSSASDVLPALNHNEIASPMWAAAVPGPGTRTNVPPVAPRVASTRPAADSSFIVSRIVPRLTEYSAASSASDGSRCPGGS